MPQNKIVQIEEIDSSNLPKLDIRRMEFVCQLLEGKTAVDAFIAAFEPSPDASRNSLTVKAHKVRHEDGVKQWVSAGKLAGFKQATWTAERLIRELESDRELAKQSGNLAVSVQALDKIAKASGLFIEKREDVTPSVDLSTMPTLELIGNYQALAEEITRRRLEAQAEQLDESVGEEQGSTVQ